MKLDFASMTHRGQVRKKNEDAFCSWDPDDDRLRRKRGSLFVVADGMGGHQGGEVASRIAVDEIRRAYYSSPQKDPGKALCEAFAVANRAIIEESLKESSLFGMGTTCTAMALVEGKAYFAHVGDSRAYLLRDGKLRQITSDHSLVWDMVRSGVISEREAENHPQRNIITRSLGSAADTAADSPATPLEVREGDVFLLCSDGLTTLVKDAEIEKLLAAAEPAQAVKALVGLANERGGRDNITVQVVKVRGED